MMSMTDLIAATQRLNEAADAYHGKSAAIDARVDLAGAEYASLSGNLKAVVNTQMLFTATLDPDEPEPTNIDGGVFKYLGDLLNAMPAGSTCNVVVPADRVLRISGIRTVHQGRQIYFSSGAVGAGQVRAKIIFETVAGPTLTTFHPFVLHNNSSVYFSNIDLELEGEKDGKPFASVYAPIVPANGMTCAVTLISSNVVCAANLALCQPGLGSVMFVGAQSGSIDGGALVYINPNFGIAAASVSSLTLLNGATVNNGGTLGADLLKK